MRKKYEEQARGSVIIPAATSGGQSSQKLSGENQDSQGKKNIGWESKKPPPMGFEKTVLGIGSSHEQAVIRERHWVDEKASPKQTQITRTSSRTTNKTISEQYISLNPRIALRKPDLKIKLHISVVGRFCMFKVHQRNVTREQISKL